MSYTLRIDSPNSAQPTENPLEVGKTSWTVGRGIGATHIRFAHDPDDNGISLYVFKLREAPQADGSISVRYIGDGPELALYAGKQLAKDEEFQWPGGLLRVRGRFGEYRLRIQSNTDIWKFDLDPLSEVNFTVTDKSRLNEPIQPGGKALFQVEVANYESGVPTDLWLQPGDSPIQFECQEPTFHGLEGNPQPEQKNAKRFQTATKNSTFTLELPLLIPIGTKAGPHEIELWVCIQGKGYKALPVTLVVASTYTFRSTFDPIEEVEKTTDGKLYLKPGRSAELKIINTAKNAQTLRLEWIAEIPNKSNDKKVIYPLAGRAKPIEVSLTGDPNPHIERPNLRWRNWQARPWPFWPWSSEELITLKISGEGENNKQSHHFYLKRDDNSWLKGILIGMSIFSALCLPLIPWMNSHYRPVVVADVQTHNTEYGDGTPVTIDVLNPTNVATVAELKNGTPNPLKLLGVTREAEMITNTYLLSTTKLIPGVVTQDVMLQINSGFPNPLTHNVLSIDCDSWLSLLFCTSLTRSLKIAYAPAPIHITKCLMAFIPPDGSKEIEINCLEPLNPLTYTVWYEAVGGKINLDRGDSKLRFTVETNPPSVISIIASETNDPVPFSDTTATIDPPWGYKELNKEPNLTTSYYYIISAPGTSITVTVLAVQPWITTATETILYDSPYPDPTKVLPPLSKGTSFLALARPNKIENVEWIRVWYNIEEKWVKREAIKAVGSIDIYSLREKSPPATPTPTATPIPPTPEPTSPPAPTPTPTLEFKLMDSSKQFNTSDSLVTIYVCVCENSGDGIKGLDGYSLKVSTPNREFKTPSSDNSKGGQIPSSLDSDKPGFNLMIKEAYIAGTWEVQLTKDGIPVSENRSYNFTDKEPKQNNMPALYLRYCKGSACD